MKQIIKNLENELENIGALIQAREDKFDSMSNNWQDSEKGDEWNDKTQVIEIEKDELISVIDELKTVL